MAAHTLLSENGTIFKQHDRGFLGRRDEMERLFCHAISKYVEAKTNTTTLYGGLTCQSGIQDTCTQEIQIKARSRRKHVDEMEFPGEWALTEVAQQIGFTISDQPSQSDMRGHSGGALAGMDIRRFSYDYPHENAVDQQPIESGCDPYPAEKTVHPRKGGYPCGYASGCAPYPPTDDPLLASEKIRPPHKPRRSARTAPDDETPQSIFEQVPEDYDDVEEPYPPEDNANAEADYDSDSDDAANGDYDDASGNP